LTFGMAAAQTPPDGGSLRQQLQPPAAPALPALQAPRPAPAAPADSQAQGPAVVVKRFEFSGATLLDDAALQAAVAPWLGQAHTLAGLQRATQAVALAYGAAGWLARADLPPQDMTDGVVRIRITEAQLSDVVFEGKPPQRIAPQQLLAIVAAVQANGAPLNLDALDRALLLANDLPGVRARLSLRAGAREGQTQAVLDVADGPATTGQVSTDNAGARSTGRGRVSALVTAHSPLGLGDQASLQASHTQGSDFIRAAYDQPVGSTGWRLGANGSALRYRLVSSDFSALDAKGPSLSLGLQASAPLWRSRAANLNLALSVDRKRFRNEAGGNVTSNYGIQTLGAGLSGNRLDSGGAGGISSGSVQWTQGRVDLSGSPNEATDAATTGTAGHYSVLRLTLARQQQLDATWSLLVNLQAQWGSKNLDSSEKLYLGGAGAVRAYPGSEAGGSQGQLLTLELQRPVQALAALPPLQLGLFVDTGYTRLYSDNGFAGAPARNGYGLSGAGASTTLMWPSHWGAAQVKLTLAHRIGSNPGATAQGKDQDGTRTLNRLWLQASLAL
jgi:hemolysin activation/secretion protein